MVSLLAGEIARSESVEEETLLGARVSREQVQMELQEARLALEQQARQAELTRHAAVTQAREQDAELISALEAQCNSLAEMQSPRSLTNRS